MHIYVSVCVCVFIYLCNGVCAHTFDMHKEICIFVSVPLWNRKKFKHKEFSTQQKGQSSSNTIYLSPV